MAPKSKLSERLPVLNEYIRRHGRAPTLEELCGPSISWRSKVWSAAWSGSWC